MKILIFGNLYCLWDKIISLEKKENPTIAVGCGFSGMYNRWRKGRIYEFKHFIPREILEKTKRENRWGGNFSKVIKSQGKKGRELYFSCPTYILKHCWEQRKTVIRLEDGRLKIDNLKTIKNGDIYRIGNVSFAGLGGRYTALPSEPLYSDAHNYRRHHHFVNCNFRQERDLIRESKVDLLFMNDIVGGHLYGKDIDFKKGERDIDLRTNKQTEINEFGTHKLCEDAEVKYCFFGGMKSDIDIFPPFTRNGEPYFWVFVRDFYDGENLYYYIFEDYVLTLKKRNFKTQKVEDILVHNVFA